MKLAQKGLSIEGIQGHNRRAILAALHDMGECSRKEISVATGLDQATVTRAIAPLIDNGIVEEVGLVRGGRGRRSINLAFVGSGRYILCLRLQRRSFSIAAFNLRGDLLETNEFPIARDGSAKQTFKEISEILDRQIGNLKQVDGIGVAVPGPFLERDERVILMTESPQWQGFDLIPELRSRYPDIPVHSTHDAKAAALTEWRHHGRALGAKVMLYVSAGQGIGSALVVDGHVHRGAQGLAGELGHTSISVDGEQCKCGNRGCLELFTSRIALLRAIRERAGDVSGTTLTSDANFSQVLDAYAAEDRLASEEVHRVARYLAQGITNCINFVNPDLVVIGDEYAGFGQNFLEQIKTHVRATVLPSIYDAVDIELSQQSEDTVLRGAFLDVLAQTYLGSPRAEPEAVVAEASG
ncbi:ROK family transcriptional regulator [Ruegeria lacuscaerulensis]|uniref:ROK family transcriptional regulator n=1 Tax=Ruegeria lacuscaerulensis TaxID=55218 RepID=UPI00147ED0A7|nr:ROK family transcriptional regulator [Ruegeria lacuscaerulensis]